MSDLVWTLGWVPEPHFLHWDWSQTFIGTSYFNLKNPPNILTVTPRIQDEKLDTLVPQKFKTCKVGSFHCKRSSQITLCDRRKSQIWFARWTIKNSHLWPNQNWQKKETLHKHSNHDSECSCVLKFSIKSRDLLWLLYDSNCILRLLNVFMFCR